MRCAMLFGCFSMCVCVCVRFDRVAIDASQEGVRRTTAESHRLRQHPLAHQRVVSLSHDESNAEHIESDGVVLVVFHLCY